jgi:hypothetical protein
VGQQRGLEKGSNMSFVCKRPDWMDGSRRTNKGFAYSGRNGGHEKKDGHNEGSHVLGSFGESIFKPSDRGQNLADGDKNITRMTNASLKGLEYTAFERIATHDPD